jgi:hypothetical protein
MLPGLGPVLKLRPGPLPRSCRPLSRIRSSCGLALRRAPLAVFAALACLAWVACVFEALAGEPHRTIDMSRALDAGPLPSSLLDIAITPTLPDPPPIVDRAQWVFDLRWDRGDVWLLGVRAMDLPSPQATPRAMGRFALELFEGPALIERVRFDFPLLGVPEPDGGVSLAAKLRTRIGVVFPRSLRGARLELWDRATNRRWSLPWPPASPASPMSDAGRGP